MVTVFISLSPRNIFYARNVSVTFDERHSIIKKIQILFYFIKYSFLLLLFFFLPWGIERKKKIISRIFKLILLRSMRSN